MRRATHILVLLAFICSCGGQWAVLQGIAWVNMVHDYAQFVPLTQAVTMTLSGQYPCKMCQVIAEKKAAEHNKLLVIEKLTKKSVPPFVIVPGAPESTPVRYREMTSFLLTRSDIPPTPPPREA